MTNYSCGAGCPGFEDNRHHPLDCPDPYKHDIEHAILEASSALGAAHRGLWAVDRLDMARRRIDAATKIAVQEARAQGASWDEIAKHLGVSKQAAHQRYSAKKASSPVDPQQLTIGDE